MPPAEVKRAYIIKKRVMAGSIAEAYTLDTIIKPEEIWLDEKQPAQDTSAIGFFYQPPPDE